MKLYTAKPRKVQAEQYLEGLDPLPAGVDTCELPPVGLHAHTDAGTKPLHPTDWLIWDRKGERLKDVLSDADFLEEFGGGPPTADT